MENLLPLGKKTTLAKALETARQDGHTHEAVQANYARVVTEIETEMGPHDPSKGAGGGDERAGSSRRQRRRSR
jgi:hypothetical protein